MSTMIKDGVSFDFNELPAHMIERSWVPSYCRPEVSEGVRMFEGWVTACISEVTKALAVPGTARCLPGAPL